MEVADGDDGDVQAGDGMTKEQFLARMANAWDEGLCTDQQLRLMERWLDFVMRFEGGQMQYVRSFMEDEWRRTGNFSRTLAGDHEGYKLIQLAAIVTHPCQECATSSEKNTDVWWTRAAFCPHKEKKA